WITSTRFLSCSNRISAIDSGRLLSPIFTAKLIVLRIIWPISVIPMCSFFHIFDMLDRSLSHQLRYNVIGVSLIKSVNILNNI
ncbi:hypothetical protein LINGRAHAP2_LOCUS32582, partial [Linum grandiflorum]